MPFRLDIEMRPPTQLIASETGDSKVKADGRFVVVDSGIIIVSVGVAAQRQPNQTLRKSHRLASLKYF